MENLYTTIKVPNGVNIYIFGSALVKSAPRDIDILIVYDRITVSPNDVRATCSELLSTIQNLFKGINLDVLFLTEEENLNIQFVQKYSAISLLSYLQLRKNSISKHDDNRTTTF